MRCDVDGHAELLSEIQALQSALEMGKWLDDTRIAQLNLYIKSSVASIERKLSRELSICGLHLRRPPLSVITPRHPFRVPPRPCADED